MSRRSASEGSFDGSADRPSKDDVDAPSGRVAGYVDYPYDGVAWCYDALAAAYSMGRIARSRRRHLKGLAPGDEVLYAGAGRGREAIAAARAGARVTAVDLSSAMLGRLARDAHRAGVAIELIQGDVTDVVSARRFDWVVAHYFLNLYGLADARGLLARLVERLRPSGRLCIADFAPARTGGWARALTRAYYAPLNAVAASLGLCARHPIPDYRPWLDELGLRVLDEARFPLPVAPAVAYWTLIAQRPQGVGSSEEVPASKPGPSAGSSSPASSLASALTRPASPAPADAGTSRAAR